MGARLTDDRIEREIRRHQLLRRLLAHQARTQTICELTGITRHQLVTLRERWRITQDMRYRGPSPKSFVVLMSSAHSRSESTTLAALCQILGAVSADDLAKGGQGFLSLETGERLCDVYEAYCACFARSEFNFEQLLLLARGSAQGDVIALEHCAKCDSAILVDRLGLARRVCPHCQHGAASASSVQPGEAESSKGEKPDGVQQELF